MDKLTARILFELDRNARSSATAIGKNVRSPEETVRYRIRQLIEDGTIKQTFAIVNAPMIGFSHYKIMLKFMSAREEDIIAVMGKICVLPSVRWVARYDGAFDLGIGLRVRGDAELVSVWNELLNLCKRLVVNWRLSLNSEVRYLSRDYLIGKRERSKEGVRLIRYGVPPVAIDSVDTSILTELAKDARATTVTIAESLAQGPLQKVLSVDAVQNRLRKLEKQNVILGYGIHLGTDIPNLCHYKILLNLSDLSPRNLSSRKSSGLKSRERFLSWSELLACREKWTVSRFWPISSSARCLLRCPKTRRLD